VKNGILTLPVMSPFSHRQARALRAGAISRASTDFSRIKSFKKPASYSLTGSRG